jgi:CspA family cold shock protein
MTGKIKFYNGEKGFGFIAPDDGASDLFFHISGVSGDESQLQDGTAVTYEIGEGKKGPCAVEVTTA